MMKKRVLSLAVILMLIASMVMPMTGFAASTQVDKVIFKNLNTTVYGYTALSGIRFFNNSVMIPSGNIINTALLSGETDNMVVTFSGAYNGNDYYSPNVVDTSKDPYAVYSTGNSWLQYSSYPDMWIEVDFKTSVTMDQISFVPRPDTYNDRGVTSPFLIEVYKSNGEMDTYNITPITEANTAQVLALTGTSTNPRMDVEATKYDLTNGEVVDVNVFVDNASNIYAEDFTVEYDKDAFEIISKTVSDATAYSIYHNSSSINQERFVVASNGPSYGINDKQSLVTIKFKAKYFNGSTDIKVVSGKIADGNGAELTAEVFGKTFNITSTIDADVNNDGLFTLGDLAIASKLIDSISSVWGTYEPDVDSSGAVDTVDLTKIVSKIIG